VQHWNGFRRRCRNPKRIPWLYGTIDGTIQRFEFVIELYWKTLKRLLALEGINTYTPRESL